MALTDDLVLYWKFEEASGNRVATVGGLTLTDNNTCPQVAGKSGNAVGFTSANSEYLNHVDNDFFSIDKAGTDGFSVCFWCYPTADLDPGGIASKGKINGGNKMEWFIEQDNATNSVLFWISYDGENVSSCNSTNMTINAWNFVACRYRSSDGQFSVQVNCDAPGSQTLSPNTPYNGTEEFAIGRYFTNIGVYWDGRIDEFGIWQRYLSDEELDILCLGTSFYPFAPSYTRVWSWVGGG